jgi:hypothetical protein
MRGIIIALPVMLFCTTLSRLSAQEMPVPVKLHVALFKKMFLFNRTLQAKPIKVLVIYADASNALKDEVVKSFADLGIPAIAAKPEQAAKLIGDASVVYVAPGAASGASAIQKLCEEKNVLSITGVPSLVESGKVCAAIGTEAGKPKVFVNTTLAKAQGQDLTQDLLRVAKVIQ